MTLPLPRRQLRSLRPRRRSLTGVLAGALALAVGALAACTDPTDTGGGGDGQPVRGGSVTIAIDAEPTGYDPTTGTVPGAGALSIPTALYTTLTALADDGSYQPFFATSVEPNADATVWTVKIPTDKQYSDGTPIDAASVVFNLERFKATGLAYAEAETFAATDAATVTIRMNRPWSALPAILASQAGWLASPTAVQQLGKDFPAKPVGSGPFVMAENVPGDHVTLKRNPKYWRGDVVHLDQVTFRPIADADSRLSALQAGDVDAATVDAGSAKQANLQGGGFTVNQKAASTDLVYFNTGIPALSDVRVRQALAYATDRQSLVKSVWKGVGDVASAPVTPDTPFAAKVDFPGYDQNKAKDLLAQYGKPVSITLSFSNDPTQQLTAQALQSMWKAVGVDVKLGTPQEAGTHAQAVIGKKYEAAVFAFPTVLDPDKWFTAIWKSGAVLNVSNYQDPAIDAALATAGQSKDLAVRKEQYGLVQQRLAQQIYAVFLHHPVQTEALRTGVHGAADLTLAGGRKAPFGADFRVPFTVETMWRG